MVTYFNKASYFPKIIYFQYFLESLVFNSTVKKERNSFRSISFILTLTAENHYKIALISSIT